FKGGYPDSCSDGIQTAANPTGTIIRFNEFTGMAQGSCVTMMPVQQPHVDPIQLNGLSNTLIEGNYFHDNEGSGGIMGGNDNRHHTIENNVFVCTCGYSYSIYAGGSQYQLIQHNVFAGGGTVRFDTNNDGASSNETVRDNVFDTGGITSSVSGWGTADHNLN